MVGLLFMESTDQSDEHLSVVLKAMSDGTRRALLTYVCQHGATRVTDLARGYDMSLNAISKHIKILEKAGLIQRTTRGRTHWIEANLSQIDAVDQWMTQLKSIWDLRLEKLNEIIEQKGK